MGATVIIRPSGFKILLSVSWVGLCSGSIDQRTFELASLAFLANSFTPKARITFPSATWTETPSSITASKKSRANSGFCKSLAKPSFQSLLLRAIFVSTLILSPILLRLGNAFALAALISANQQENEVHTILPEINAIAGSDVELQLRHTSTDRPMHSEIFRLDT
jgi:hypothetical protein